MLAQGDPADRRLAMSELLTLYRGPLVAYLHHKGLQPADADDLVQSFCGHLLEGPGFAKLLPGSQFGRFRSYLLRALENHWSHQREAVRAAKRGGQAGFEPLTPDHEEKSVGNSPASSVTPVDAFVREWALTTIRSAMQRLKLEQTAKGKSEMFQRLLPHLEGDPGESTYAAIAASLGVSEGALKVLVHRLRQRFRDLLRAEIAATVSDPGEIDEELAELIQAVRG